MPGYLAAPDAGMAEWREQMRPRAGAQAAGLDPDESYVAIVEAEPDRDSRALLDYDPRPPLQFAWCTKPLRYLKRGRAPTSRGNACRKRFDRKASTVAAAKSVGIVPPGERPGVA